MKPVFLVRGFDWNDKSAGVQCLHLLCHKLRERGEEAYMNECRMNFDLNTRILSKELALSPSFQNRKIIVVEPEVVGGNPSFADLVVRWLLNYPGKANKDVSHLWGKDDLLCHYDNIFAMKNSIPLCIPCIDRSIFNNDDNPMDGKRDIDSFYAKKAIHAGEKSLCPSGALDVTFMDVSKEQLADIFRRTKKFYSMEMTGCLIEAQLCGAECHLLLSNYMPENPISDGDYIAYQNAIEKRSDKEIDDFIRVCYERVGLKEKVYA